MMHGSARACSQHLPRVTTGVSRPKSNPSLCGSTQVDYIKAKMGHGEKRLRG